MAKLRSSSLFPYPLILAAWFLMSTAAALAEPTATTPPLYGEQFRPQFHFTPQKNWMNDPNGLVFYEGKYHLFFQHNPHGINWGNMTWGHATSSDLVHWTQHEHALHPDKFGTCFSGSGVVDWNNDSGLQDGDEEPILLFYTGAGKPFTQCLAYSTDGGQTFQKYEHNPVIGNISGKSDRDPKVFFHKPTKRWVMVLYVEPYNDKPQHIQILTSENLTTWEHQSDVHNFFECPDLFELPVDGDANSMRWVIHGAAPNYLIGKFDGKKFEAESERLTYDYGKNFYAAQSYSDIPANDGRRIQIGWMRGGSYPNMPFNQQMTFPCSLTLRTTPAGIRLFREPVKELEELRDEEQHFTDLKLIPDEDPVGEMTGELLDIRVDFQLSDAIEFGLRVRGEPIVYNVEKKEISSLGKTAPLVANEGRIKLQILVDRSSIEVFGNEGVISMSTCFLPAADKNNVEFFSAGGDVQIVSLDVYHLRSAWPAE